MNPERTVQHTVYVLNELLALDPGIARLFENYVEVNTAIAEHPRAQVKTFGGEVYHLGVLGLLNAFVEGEKVVAAQVEDDGTISSFVAIVPTYTDAP